MGFAAFLGNMAGSALSSLGQIAQAKIYNK